MLVEINLLPQKQRKSSTTIRIAIALSLLLLVVILLLLWQVQSYKQKINGVQSNINMFEQNIADLQQNEDVASTNSYVELSEAVEWSESHPIKSVPVLQHLTSLLPERGFIQNYGYSDEGTITLTVQFDTKKEAASYLKWLNDSEWTKEVTLSNLTSNQIEGTTGETVQDTQTAESLPPDTPLTGTEIIDTPTQEAEKTETQNKDIQTDTQIDEESYLPRYIGNYLITLDREKVREIQLEENGMTEEEEEGGNE